MQQKIKLILAYDGADFHGWQAQPGRRTVQEELERVAARVLRHPVSIFGASRTDAGVHARGQVAHLLTTRDLPPERLARALACRLPEDMTIVHAARVPPAFHASRDAVAKLYRYGIHLSPRRPVEMLDQRRYWHVWIPLDPQAMRAAARLLVGTHDFAGFANQGMPRATTVRTIRRLAIWQRYERLFIDVEGDAFLYNQVRIIVGTLVEIGRAHWRPERVLEILASRDRTRAGATAPAQGLSLEWVRYPALRDPMLPVAGAGEAPQSAPAAPATLSEPEQQRGPSKSAEAQNTREDQQWSLPDA